MGDAESQIERPAEAFQEAPVEWSRLGFRGFVIREGAALGIPAQFGSIRGHQDGHGKAAKYLKDTTGLEQSLIVRPRSRRWSRP